MKITHFTLLAASASLLFAASDAPKRLDAAADVMTDIMAAPDKGIPQDLLDKSECVVIVPGLKKGAFIIGGKYGKGFLSCRKAGAGWSAPGAIRVEGGSVGLQIGGSETDVILLVMNQGGVKKLLSSKFTLGADASAAARIFARSQGPLMIVWPDLPRLRPEHAEAMVKWTMIGLMTRRLAPAPGRRPWQKTRAA